MAEDGKRDARWTGSAISAQSGGVYSQRADVDQFGRSTDRTVYTGDTEVEAFGRGMGRHVPGNADLRDIDRNGPLRDETDAGYYDAPQTRPLQGEEEMSRAGNLGDESAALSAVGPQGWRGDYFEVIHADPLISVHPQVGPQGWEASEPQASADQSEKAEGSIGDQTMSPQERWQLDERVEVPPEQRD
jgi:hypothetical protein